MKKIVCIFLSLIMTLCLFSCNSSNGDGEIKDVATLMMLCNAKETKYENYPQKMTMDMKTDVQGYGSQSDAEMNMTLYVKETVASSVISGEIRLSGSGMGSQLSLVYYEDGILYTFVSGETYKQELSYDDALGSAGVSADMDFNGMIDNSKSYTLTKRDGNYVVTIELDTQKESGFMQQMIEGLNSSGVDGVIENCSAELSISSKFIVYSIKMKFDTVIQEQNVGAVRVSYDVAMNRTILSEDYEITVPEDIDIEKAVAINEELIM